MSLVLRESEAVFTQSLSFSHLSVVVLGVVEVVVVVAIVLVLVAVVVAIVVVVVVVWSYLGRHHEGAAGNEVRGRCRHRPRRRFRLSPREMA